MSFRLARYDLILEYPRYQVSPSFNAGNPIERSIDSTMMKAFLSKERLQSERAAIHDPEIEGRENNGGRRYSSRDMLRRR